MANKFPEIKKENQGNFTSWAKQNGFKDACSGASAVMGNTEKYKGKKYKGSDVIEMANYAHNFGCKSKGGPKQKSSDKDPSGDGKYTKKDFLINIGVLDKEGNKIEKKKKK